MKRILQAVKNIAELRSVSVSLLSTAIVALCLTSVTSYAAAPVFTAILGGSGQDYASAVTTDPQGNTYVAGLTYSPDFKATAGAYQTRHAGVTDAFVAKFAPGGALLWSTLLGGCCDDWATGVAVDSAGNVIVTGWTRSVDFPVLKPAQATLNNGVSPARYDAFVAKLSPNGDKLVWSTFLGGPDDDGAYALALDAAGNAYLTGSINIADGFTGFKGSPTGSGAFVAKFDPQGALVYNYFHARQRFAELANAGIAVDAAGSSYVAGTMATVLPTNPTQSFGPAGDTQAIVFKLSPDGTQKVYETAIGGSADSYGMAVAVDRTGAAYLAGVTTSVDFHLVKPLQSNFGARSLWKSTDSAATWRPLSDLPFAYLQALVADPGTPATLYAASTDGGVFKSIDAGATWVKASRGIAGSKVQSLAIDPLHPQTLFAAAAPAAGQIAKATLYKSTDGAANWTLVDSADNNITVQVAIDAQNPAVVYWRTSLVMRKSTDGGVTWANIVFPGTDVSSFALDPRVTGSIYAYSTQIFLKGGFVPPYIYRSSDGGLTWKQLSEPVVASNTFTVDASTNPTTIYNGVSSRSNDGGVTWTPLPAAPVTTANTTAIAVDAAGKLYAATESSGLFTSTDRGVTWLQAGAPLLPGVRSLAALGGTVYAILQNIQTSGFLTKLSPDGASLQFSTFLNGHVSFGPSKIFAAEPNVFTTQNWISAVALDPAGNPVVAGGTRASDFLPSLGVQRANAGNADAIVATIASDGSKLLSSTYFGASADESALAVAVDAQGNTVIAGQTWSLDSPVPGGVQAPAGLGEAFVAKFAPAAAPVITDVTNAASFQPGISAGSWVMIRGANLANTNPGRIWRDEEVVGGKLPTALDGVSVTINGKPAFVYYISATQINVQAPSDSAVGPVNVVVTNNGTASAAATAQLQAAAPTFFLYPNTNIAVATRAPDYAYIGDPSVTPGAVAAKPGEVLTLWATGFGATAPPTAAGSAVVGAPAVAAPVTVTVGGQPATLLSAVLSPGSAGLYQIAIQLPATLPTGAVSLQASTGGATSPAGVSIFVGK
ncbi:MAG: SBBP repeat-containing protein [Candidatus Solibacter sp.]